MGFGVTPKTTRQKHCSPKGHTGTEANAQRKTAGKGWLAGKPNGKKTTRSLAAGYENLF